MESKESRLWLKHIMTYDLQDLETERLLLLRESEELMKKSVSEIYSLLNCLVYKEQ